MKATIATTLTLDRVKHSADRHTDVTNDELQEFIAGDDRIESCDPSREYLLILPDIEKVEVFAQFVQPFTSPFCQKWRVKLIFTSLDFFF